MTQTGSKRQFALANVDGSIIVYLRLQSDGSYQRTLVSDAFESEDESGDSINEKITKAISTYFGKTRDVRSGYYFIVRADENTTCVENMGYFFEDTVEKLQNLNIVIPFIKGETQRIALIPFEDEAIVARENIQFDGRIFFRHHTAEQIAVDED